MVEILNNPTIKNAVKFEQYKDEMIGTLTEVLMSTKTWHNMNADERRMCIRHIVNQVESKDDLQQRLRNELGLGCCAINWHLPVPGDKTDEEARMLVKALGGLVAKNGALVMIMTFDGSF